VRFAVTVWCHVLFPAIVGAVIVNAATSVIIYGTDILTLKAILTGLSSTGLTIRNTTGRFTYGMIRLAFAIVRVTDATASTVNVHTNPILAFLAWSTKLIGVDAGSILASYTFLLLTDWLARSIVTFGTVSTVNWDTFVTQASHARIITLVNAVPTDARGTASTVDQTATSSILVTRGAWIRALRLADIVQRITRRAVAAVNWDTFVTHASHARFIAEIDAVSPLTLGAAFTVDTVTFSGFFVAR